MNGLVMMLTIPTSKVQPSIQIVVLRYQKYMTEGKDMGEGVTVC